MIIRIDYANADGTRTAQVLRCNAEHMTTWDVVETDYGKTVRYEHHLTLQTAQRLAREWTR